MKFQSFRIIFTLTSICIFLFSNQAFSQTCDSSDKRDMVEQLDCYCSSNDKSVVQQKVESLGVLKNNFKNRDCSSAVLITLTSSKDDKVNTAVVKKLESLNFSKDQMDVVSSAALKTTKFSKLIKSGECSKGTLTIKFWPFSSKSSQKPAACEEFEKLPELERQVILTNVMLQGFQGPTSFNEEFKKIEIAKLITEKFPEGKIVKCMKFANESEQDSIACLESGASEEKIDSCGRLGMIQSDSLQCLKTNADPTSIAACKQLGMIGSETIECLQIAPNSTVALSCRSLGLIGSETLQCLRINPSQDVALSCRKLGMIGSETLQCLRLNPSADVALSCRNFGMIGSDTLQCLRIKPPQDVAKACKNLNLIGSDTLACISSSAQPDDIHQCGLKNLIGSETIQCIKQAYNKRSENLKVTDSQRAPKEKTQGGASTLNDASGISGTSK